MTWYTLYTKPYAEPQVDRAFQNQKLETFLPTVPAWRARRRRMEEEPLFPRYMFADIDFDRVGLSEVAWTPGLLYIVGSEAGAPTPVPEEIIAYIRRRVEGVTGQGGLAPFREGEPVRIKEGPFQDIEAVFAGHLSGYERAQVLLEILGRVTRYEVPTAWLEKS